MPGGRRCRCTSCRRKLQAQSGPASIAVQRGSLFRQDRLDAGRLRPDRADRPSTARKRRSRQRRRHAERRRSAATSTTTKRASTCAGSTAPTLAQRRAHHLRRRRLGAARRSRNGIAQIYSISDDNNRRRCSDRRRRELPGQGPEGPAFQDDLTFTDLHWDGDHLVKTGFKYKEVEHQHAGEQSGQSAVSIYNVDADAAPTSIRTARLRRSAAGHRRRQRPHRRTSSSASISRTTGRSTTS